MNEHAALTQRKIIHVDMDAFYASVELLKRPELKGKALVVAGQSDRSVVCTASYEARKFGVHSAMSVRQAKKLCPNGIYIQPDFARYKQMSVDIHQIFRKYTDLIEPLSLDEAYLDVTTNKVGAASATAIAQAIRAEIFQQTGLTASAGIANNKFLAKIASDWNKPDGIFVISPSQVEAFLLHLSLEKIPGVGKVTLAKLHRLHMYTIADLRTHSLGELVLNFGKYGYRLHDLAYGIDHRAVNPYRETKQISAETTFEQDLSLGDASTAVLALAQSVIAKCQRKGLFGYCATVKLKTADFRIITRSVTLANPLYELPHFVTTIEQLIAHLDEQDKAEHYRLIGVGVSEFIDKQLAAKQLALFV
ncbi:DNA polymerase IV [Brackiella oedipodis]|uniref:DNA polymerase IV n=1 Tax=Brackiella oedipodis TaxID=124225 RepID=UPI00048CD223|nr:DNA polymerase IV [Brackiella oedipodis]